MQPAATLTRQSHRQTRPVLRLFDEIELPLGRVHEICGPARRMLAARIAGRMEGPVFWIRPSWHPDRLYLPTAAKFFNPGRLTFLEPNRVDEFLWAMEQALRDGAVPLVVGDFHATVELTPVRRLNLAAEAAFEERARVVTGLLLAPGQGGSPGVETRWHVRGRHGPGKQGWQIERRRARMAPPKAWALSAEGRLTPADYTGN